MKFIASLCGAALIGYLLSMLGEYVLDNVPEPYGHYAIILFCATLVGTTLGILMFIDKREKTKEK